MYYFKLLTSSLAICLLLSGCGSDRKPTFPVKGKVLVDGKPAHELFIHFWPTEKNDPKSIRPFAQTNENGEFELNSYVTGDGSPTGEFIVTFEWPMRSGAFKNQFEGPDRLRGKYKVIDQSPFKVNIDKQGKVLDTFELTTK